VKATVIEIDRIERVRGLAAAVERVRCA